MKDNVIKFPTELVSPRDVVQALSEDLSGIEELYCVAVKDGRTYFYLAGDLQGAVFAAQCLNDKALKYVSGRLE